MTRSTKILLVFATLLIAAMVSAACAGDEAKEPVASIPYTPPDATPVGFDPTRCERTVGMGLVVEAASIQDGVRAHPGQRVRSANYPEYFFEAVDLEIDGHDGPGPVAVYVYLALPPENLYPHYAAPFNSIAIDHFRNDWINQGSEVDVSSIPDDVEGENVAIECSLKSEREEPEILVESEMFKPGIWYLSPGDIPTMLAEVEGNTRPRCIEIYFSPTMDDPETFAISSWEHGGRAVWSRDPLICYRRLSKGLIDQPKVLIESVPEEYRHLIEN